MSLKFFNPFGKSTLRITRTTHGSNAKKPSDLSVQQAIDCVGVLTDSKLKQNGKVCKIHAVADGKIVGVHKYGSSSYITLDIGEKFYVLYVHCYSYVKIGDTVKRGQEIGETVVYNSMHLHLALQNKDRSKPTDNPMEYLDRAIDVIATHPDIIKIWCTPNGKIKWALFADKYIGKKVEMPTVKTGDIITANSIRNIREQANTNSKAKGQLKVNDSRIVKSNKFPINDGYSWIQIDDGWVAYKSSWFTTKTPVPMPPISGENNENDITHYKITIDSLRATVARLEREQLKSDAKIAELTKELKNRDESIKRYKATNERLSNQIRETREVASKFETVWGALSGLVSALLRTIKSE